MPTSTPAPLPARLSVPRGTERCDICRRIVTAGLTSLRRMATATGARDYAICDNCRDHGR